MTRIPQNISGWILTEGMAGTENQCIGVAEALGLSPDIKRVQLRRPWKWFSPPLLKAHSGAFDPPLQGPWPDLLIASGRKSVLASLFIKRQSRGQTFTVQIQDPKISSRHFDLVAVPYHDDLRGDNVIVTDGAPNKVTDERLREGREKFGPALTHLPAKKAAVLIGGKSKAFDMTQEDTKKLALQLKALVDKNDIGLMITASRRTGSENMRILRDILKGDHIYFWNGRGENPYFGFLALADYILVSQDSVSMTSEAASTGKPVYIIPLSGGSRRINKFHRHLCDKNVVKEFDGKLQKWSYKPLNDSQIVADEIKRCLVTRKAM